MPKCDRCGFAHASKDHCINCGDTDPFRRRRLFRMLALVAALVVGGAALFYFYLRYDQIERSVRMAEQAAKDRVPFIPVPPPRE